MIANRKENERLWACKEAASEEPKNIVKFPLSPSTAPAAALVVAGVIGSAFSAFGQATADANITDAADGLALTFAAVLAVGLGLKVGRIGLHYLGKLLRG